MATPKKKPAPKSASKAAPKTQSKKDTPRDGNVEVDFGLEQVEVKNCEKHVDESVRPNGHRDGSLY